MTTGFDKIKEAAFRQEDDFTMEIMKDGILVRTQRARTRGGKGYKTVSWIELEFADGNPLLAVMESMR